LKGAGGLPVPYLQESVVFLQEPYPQALLQDPPAGSKIGLQEANKSHSTLKWSTEDTKMVHRGWVLIRWCSDAFLTEEHRKGQHKLQGLSVLKLVSAQIKNIDHTD
jgi:hypothetical protein